MPPKTPPHVIDLIEKAYQQKAEFLDLGNCGLTAIPPEIKILSPFLKELNFGAYYISRDKAYIESNNNFSKNNFSKEPNTLEYLSELPSIKSLYVYGCLIGETGARHISQLTQLTSLDLSYNQIGDTGTQHISQLTQLTSLNLSFNLIGDKGVQHISQLTQLTSLDLKYNQIGDTGAQHISQLTQLTSLDLSDNQIGDTGAQHISQLTQLTSLDLSFSLIGEKGAQYISQLSVLTSLDLSFTLIGVEGVQHISQLLALTSLNLSANQIGDTGAQHISQLTQLTYLILSSNQIGDKGAQHISQLTQLTFLDLGNNQIGDKGVQHISQLTQLSSLYLGNNKIGDTGVQHISQLTQLTSLYLNDNQIGDTGAQHISQLTQLTSLDLSYNQIGDTGAQHISQLTQLSSLKLSDNKIGDKGVQHISQLTQLTSLDLTSNQIGDEDAKHISQLTQLTSLNLNSNQIGDTGAQYISQLTQLTSLYLSYNQIGDKGVQHISQLTQLTSLNLSDNQIGDTGAQYISKLSALTSLVLDFNKIGGEGAEHFQNLAGLTILSIAYNYILTSKPLKKLVFIDEIYFKQNPLNDLPDYIADEGDKIDLLNWWAEVENPSNTQKNNWVKLQVIGNGDVGKTSLIEAMQNGKCTTVHESSHGVVLKNFSAGGKENIQLQVFDFGGQEIYHGTHRMFLTPNAVQLLVFDHETEQRAIKRIPRTDRIDNRQKIYDYSLPYWHNLLKEESHGCVLIVAQNKSATANAKTNSYHNLLKSFTKYYIKTDAFAPLNISELNSQVYNAAKTLREFGIYMPKSWIAVRQFFIDNVTHSHSSIKTMSKEEFYALCHKHGVFNSSYYLLLQTLHYNGLVYYNEDLLPKTIITDLRWALNAIYKPLNRQGYFHEDLIDQRGRCKAYEVFKAFGNEYDQNQKWVFLNFMQSCGICFPHKTEHYHKLDENTIYIFPNYLSDTETESIEKEWQTAEGIKKSDSIENLNFSIAQIFSFLSVMGTKTYTRFIWKYGILFTTGSGKFKITFNPPGNVVIEQIGPVDSKLLQLIYDQLVKNIFKRDFDLLMKNPHGNEPKKTHSFQNIFNEIKKTDSGFKPPNNQSPVIPDVVQPVIPDIIASYAKENVEVVKEVNKQFSVIKDQVRFLWDKKIDGHGETLKDKLLDMFHNSNGYIAFISPDYVDSSLPTMIHDDEIPLMKEHIKNKGKKGYGFVVEPTLIPQSLKDSFYLFDKGKSAPEESYKRSGFIVSFMNECIIEDFLSTIKKENK